MLYKILWKATIYGESSVEAGSIKNAKEKALMGHDKDDFEVITQDGDRDWKVDKITKIPKK